MGIPLALTKGVRGSDGHKWIGTALSLRTGMVGPEAIVTVPDAFSREHADQLRPYASGEGHLAESTTELLLGKTGRLVYIVPTTRPYITGLWGALAGARAARGRGKREAPPREGASQNI